MIYGLDIASFQSTTVPSRTPGDEHVVDFCFIKATQGTNYINPRMAAQAASAREQGMVVGFYHFLEKGNIQAQCEYFVSHAVSRPGDVLAIDWETDPATGLHPTSFEKDDSIHAVQALRPTHKCLLYCNVSFWKTIDTSGFAGDGLWIATADPHRYPAGQPPIRSPWLIHQYSTAKSYDHDVAQFSSLAEMVAWAGGEGDVALTDAEIKKIADAVFLKIFKTDGVLASPPDAADHATNPYWAFQTHVQNQTTTARAVQDTVEGILAQAKANGETLSAVKAMLAAVDLSKLPDALAAKLAKLEIVLKEQA